MATDFQNALIHFMSLFTLYTPLKHQKTTGFLMDVYRGYRKRKVSWNGLKQRGALVLNRSKRHVGTNGHWIFLNILSKYQQYLVRLGKVLWTSSLNSM